MRAGHVCRLSIGSRAREQAKEKKKSTIQCDFCGCQQDKKRLAQKKKTIGELGQQDFFFSILKERRNRQPRRTLPSLPRDIKILLVDL